MGGNLEEVVERVREKVRDAQIGHEWEEELSIGDCRAIDAVYSYKGFILMQVKNK